MPTAISGSQRDRSIDELEASTFGCVVIGGGIAGAGIARQASLRGLRAALLEANDFASGTSSRSTKLIHGGLRYLAMREFNMVKETALERKIVHRLAPHLAEPRWMVMPARNRATLMTWRLAVSTYERLGEVDDRDKHGNWGASDLEREEPAVDQKRFPHACVYREYLTDDARLVLANLRDATHHGTVALNYARVERVLQENGRAVGVEAVCNLTGRRFVVRTHCVINAAGPWIEGVRRLEDPDAESVLHLSKGVHIVLPAETLPVRNLLMLRTSDKRYVFAIRRDDVVYVGTTDTTYKGGARLWPEIDRDDVEYLLDVVAEHCAPFRPRASDCVAAWAGLRSLVAESGKEPDEISRHDEVYVGPSGMVSVAGGKLTGYRMIAMRVLEEAAKIIGTDLPPMPSELEPLPGGHFDGDMQGLAARVASELGLSEGAALRLVRLYGTEATSVGARGAQSILPNGQVLTGEIDWAVREEGAVRLEDVVYRRTRAALYVPSEREALLEPIAARMASLLGWDDARCEEEVARTRALIEEELRSVQ